MLDRMLENRGVQMMLGNLIKAAAPELTATVQQVATLIENFDKRLARIEQQLKERSDDGSTAGANAGNAAGANAGNAANESAGR